MKTVFKKNSMRCFGRHFQYILIFVLLFVCDIISAQDMAAGAGAIRGVAAEIRTYIGPVQTLIYSIAGVVALAGGVSVYIKMNNEEQDVKKSIMLLIGSCVFLIAAAQALPKFFGM